MIRGLDVSPGAQRRKGDGAGGSGGRGAGFGLGGLAGALAGLALGVLTAGNDLVFASFVQTVSSASHGGSFRTDYYEPRSIPSPPAENNAPNGFATPAGDHP